MFLASSFTYSNLLPFGSLFHDHALWLKGFARMQGCDRAVDSTPRFV
jgi:hypothetical protein